MVYDSHARACLSMSLGASSGSANLSMGHRSAVVIEAREQSKLLSSFQQGQRSSFQQGQRSHHLLPKPPKMGPGTEASNDMLPQVRVARPPVEGRGRNQLLPLYWPRITDQELQQISGDSNSTIVPLFEKVLSASDAGRIGRLVLPKAWAEPLDRSTDPHLSAMLDHLHSVDGNTSWRKTDNHGGRVNEGLSLQSLLIPEKKRSCSVNSEDVMELRMTWEEAQVLLRPPPSAQPSIVMIDDY